MKNENLSVGSVSLTRPLAQGHIIRPVSKYLQTGPNLMVENSRSNKKCFLKFYKALFIRFRSIFNHQISGCM